MSGQADGRSEDRPEERDGASSDAPVDGAADGSASGPSQAGDDRAELARQFQAAAERSGLGALARDERLTAHDVLAAVGGVRGLLEALLPGLVFLVTYAVLTSLVGQDPQAALVPALGASVGLAVVFTVARLVARSQPTQAIAGLVGVLLSAALALWTGNARDNYFLGFLTNAGYALALFISLLVKWPALGLIVGFLVGDGTSWRSDPRKVRLAQVLTVAWIGFFLLRLVVQVPLYLVNDVAGLGLSRLLMGVPLYALMLVLTWLFVRATWVPANAAER
ncbi:DUF3159 domain-containing protein [Agromyces sp. MMS24-K17]|uniref:DUF3159 domain-containing protein n=1 Tax=Agromyces sp. MMS24-K17 TaxID=3372850 RepID=UPI00375472D1